MLSFQRAAKSLYNRAATARAQLRGLIYRAVYAPVWSAAPGLWVDAGVKVEVYGDLRLGRNVKLSAGSCLVAGPGATLEIGDGVFIGRNTIIVATESIRIGAGTDVAEHCTIRDADHDLLPEGRAAGRAMKTPIDIGERCWLGAGVRVLRGTRLGAGVVVGANAVVKGIFESELVIAGAPARVVKKLER
jgi:acetyltransferase-like isoleucine patch superfamily enzyme